MFRPSTFQRFHDILVRCKYRPLFGAKGRRRPGPKGPSKELIDAVAVCRMFNCAISKQSLPKYLPTDTDPGKTGCDSVMESRHSECNDLNAKKDRACQVQGSCDLDKHIAQIAEYKAAVERLNLGQIAEADRDSFKASIEKMKAELDARKNDAEANERAARECADAREAVYDFFDDDVIPDTERAADEANDRREDLLEELDKAEVVQQAAKDKRDELAGIDPEKDKARWDEYVKMRDEYEKNAAAYRDAEARLAEFTRTHGNDIDRYVQRLVA